jgi:hypothetical protein
MVVNVALCVVLWVVLWEVLWEVLFHVLFTVLFRVRPRAKPRMQRSVDSRMTVPRSGREVTNPNPQYTAARGELPRQLPGDVLHPRHPCQWMI